MGMMQHTPLKFEALLRLWACCEIMMNIANSSLCNMSQSSSHMATFFIFSVSKRDFWSLVLYESPYKVVHQSEASSGAVWEWTIQRIHDEDSADL